MKWVSTTHFGGHLDEGFADEDRKILLSENKGAASYERRRLLRQQQRNAPKGALKDRLASKIRKNAIGSFCACRMTQTTEMPVCRRVDICPGCGRVSMFVDVFRLFGHALLFSQFSHVHIAAIWAQIAPAGSTARDIAFVCAGKHI